MKISGSYIKSDRVYYSKENIVAVVVSYNGESLNETIDSILPQVAHIIIVDNGSEKCFLDALQSYKENSLLTIIENEENKGQAKALNQGLNQAINLGFSLILTMDQDTLLRDDCVNKLLDGMNSGYDSVGANYGKKILSKKYNEVRYLITSGNLLKTCALRKIGGFNSDLFIDSVDFDISLRLRKSGYRLAIVKDAIMTHSIGDRKSCENGDTIFEHSVKRHYYIARNHYYILYKYFMVDPIFCIKKEISYLISLLSIKKESNFQKKLDARKQGRRDALKLIKNKE
jgi:glycosyl transferase family protein